MPKQTTSLSTVQPKLSNPDSFNRFPLSGKHFLHINQGKTNVCLKAPGLALYKIIALRLYNTIQLSYSAKRNSNQNCTVTVKHLTDKNLFVHLHGL